MATVLNTFGPHLELYLRQAQDDPAKPSAAPQGTDPVAAMSPRELDEYIRFGLLLFDGLKQESEHVQEQISAKQIAFDPAISAAFLAAWGAWQAPCEAVERALRSYESQATAIPTAARFRQCVRQVKLQATDPAGLAKADQRMLAGQGISLDEALSGLRAHCRP